MYRLENILKRIVAAKKFYIFLIIEILMGSMILSVCINLFLSEKKELLEYAKVKSSSMASIIYDSAGVAPSEENDWTGIDAEMITVSMESYSDLKEEFANELKLQVSNVFAIDMFLPDFNLPYTFQVYCMEESYFSDLFGTPPEYKESAAYLGEGIHDFLEKAGTCRNDNIFSTGFKFVIHNDTLSIEDVDTFKVFKIDEINHNKIMEIPEVWSDGAYPLENALILPFEYSIYFEKLLLKENVSLPAYTQLKVGHQNADGDFKIFNRLIRYLTQINNHRFTFSVSDQYLELEKAFKDMEMFLSYWLMIGISFSALVAVGTLGVLLLLQYKRKKSNMIHYFCGATMRRLYIEMIMEVCMVLFSGSLAGNILSFYLTQNIDISRIRSSWHIESLILMIVFSFIISFFSVTISFQLNRNRSYIQQIKQD